MALNPGMSNSAQAGRREELADYLAVVDAKSTPFISMAPKGKDIGNMQFSWQVDNYSAPQLGGTADGADVTLSAGATSNASGNRTRLFNNAQVFRRVHRTGFIAETSNVAGVSSETARAVAKRLVELKRDMESTFTATNQALVNEDATPTASLTSSLGAWLTTTNASNIGAPLSGGGYEPASGSIDTTATASVVEANVQAVLTAIYGATGVFRDYDVIAGTTLKRAFTNLTTSAITQAGNANSYQPLQNIRTFNKELKDDTFKSSVDIFEGDFGRLILHPTTFLGGKNGAALSATPFKGYVIPFEMTEVRYAKLPEVKDLPDAGGGPIKLVQAIAGLVVKNPNGFGMFNAAS